MILFVFSFLSTSFLISFAPHPPPVSPQYRSTTYVATPQQYPVPAGTPGFYPGTSPAEYGTYGKRLYLGPHLT